MNDRVKSETVKCPCCGKPLMCFVVEKPALRAAVGCRDCLIFSNENGVLCHYVGEITWLSTKRDRVKKAVNDAGALPLDCQQLKAVESIL